MGLWDKLKALFSHAEEAFQYEEVERPRPQPQQRSVSFSDRETVGYSFTAPDQYQRLWNTRGLSQSQRDLITHDRNFYNMYRTAYENKRLSRYQRSNARGIIDDMLEDMDLDIQDVFDYAAWRQDMGYDRRR
jgi:hypothetical protein